MHSHKNKYKNCFKFTSLLWDLNEDRVDPYLKALRNKTPENVADFLLRWNRARGYSRDKLIKQIERQHGYLQKKPALSKGGLRDFLVQANIVLKKTTWKSNEEYIGSVKLSHIYHPGIFPIVDNPIMGKFGLKKYAAGDFEGFIQKYFDFKDAVDGSIKELGLKGIKVRGRGLYKLIDEVLYLYITQERKSIVELILNVTGNSLYIGLIDNLIKTIRQNINTGR